MNKISSIYLAISVTCFTIVWEIYQQFLSNLSVEGSPTISRWIGFLSALGLFAFLFQTSQWLSHIAIRAWLSEESKLCGEWFQIFVVHNYTKSTNPLDAIRHGPVTITLADSGLEITAENRKITPSRAPSAWYSNKVSIQGSQVWMLFSSTGPGRGSTHGNMLFQSQGKKGALRKINRLMGYFADSSPSTHFGSIEFFRSRSEYETRLRELVPNQESMMRS